MIMLFCFPQNARAKIFSALKNKQTFSCHIAIPCVKSLVTLNVQTTGRVHRCVDGRMPVGPINFYKDRL